MLQQLPYLLELRMKNRQRAMFVVAVCLNVHTKLTLEINDPINKTITNLLNKERKLARTLKTVQLQLKFYGAQHTTFH